jgi:hypothetical protein
MATRSTLQEACGIQRHDSTDGPHLLRPAGRTAHHLEALRMGIAEASAQTLFNHALGPQLRHPSAEELPPDDFSSWVNGVVQDRETAERLRFAIQECGGSTDAMRLAMIEVLDRIPEKARISRDAPEDGDFVFLEMDSVPVPSGITAANSSELIHRLVDAEPSVLFYHLVEQPWLESRPLLLEWVRKERQRAIWRLADRQCAAGTTDRDGTQAAPATLAAERSRPAVAEAAGAPEQQRREAQRQAVAGLVRRIVGPEDSNDARPGS